MGAVLLLLISCSKSEEGNPNNPNESVPDPEGTVTLSMRNGNNGSTELSGSGIYIDRADNFTGGYFVPLGPMRGLGNVTRIPVSGWTEKVAVVPGEGYVAYSTQTDQFYRLYVKEYTVTILNEVIGAEVKYQTPFTGSKASMRVIETQINLPAEGGSVPIFLESDGTMEPMSISALLDAGYIDKYRLPGGTFAPNSFLFTAPSNTSGKPIEGSLLIQFPYSDPIELPVVIAGQLPTLQWSDNPMNEWSSAAQEFNTYLHITNTSPDEVEFSTNFPDCRIEFQTYNEAYQWIYLKVTLGENNTGQPRKVVLTARTKDGRASAEVEFTQKAHDFQLAAETVNFDRQQGSYTVNMTTTASEFSVVSSDETWCTVSKTSSAIVVRATANDTSKNRTATVRVTLNDGQTKTIEVNQNRFAAGDYYDIDGVTGVVFWTEGPRWKIVSMDETQAAWSLEQVPTGATDQEDGARNQAIIQAIAGWEGLYPAFAWCAAKNAANATGWYLPASNELLPLDREAREVVNATLASNGGTAYTGENSYWFSTESSNEYARYNSYYSTNIGGGHYEADTRVKYKTNELKVRAIHAF